MLVLHPLLLMILLHVYEAPFEIVLIIHVRFTVQRSVNYMDWTWQVRQWRENSAHSWHVPDFSTRINDVSWAELSGLCTLMMPSEDALMMWRPSFVYVASLTKDVWPLNSFSVLPDFIKLILYEEYTVPYIRGSHINVDSITKYLVLMACSQR